jgi:hypothetical protein
MLTTFSPASGNSKTGPIPTTRTERVSCAPSCPFFDKGCYAKYGPEQIHWSKMNNALDWIQLCGKISKLPKGQLWRHNTAGDLPHNDGLIDYKMLRSLAMANRGRKGFTYTHHDIAQHHNLVAVETANLLGFTVNVSTESVEVADEVMTNHGIPAVAVVPSTETRRFFKTTSGRKVVVCPATIHDNVSCSTCGLCQKSDREFIIAFPAHGVAKKTVNAIVTA